MVHHRYYCLTTWLLLLHHNVEHNICDMCYHRYSLIQTERYWSYSFSHAYTNHIWHIWCPTITCSGSLCLLVNYVFAIFLYFIKKINVILIVLHMFKFSVQLFHKFSLITVIQWFLHFFLSFVFERHDPLRLCLISLILNSFWMLCDNCVFL